jgi:hypothetical protein
VTAKPKENGHSCPLVEKNHGLENPCTPAPTGRHYATLSFNDELLGMPQDLGDYVIVHELLHFSVPNHGKLWKSLMRVHLGDWESIAARLPRIQTNTQKAGNSIRATV